MSITLPGTRIPRVVPMTDAEYRAHKNQCELSQPETVVASIRPGDVIDVPLGIHRAIERVVVHAVHTYPNGSLSIRFRYLLTPFGIDWSGFIPVNEHVRVVSRGVCRVDRNTRSLLP